MTTISSSNPAPSTAASTTTRSPNIADPVVARHHATIKAAVAGFLVSAKTLEKATTHGDLRDLDQVLAALKAQLSDLAKRNRRMNEVAKLRLGRIAAAEEAVARAERLVRIGNYRSDETLARCLEDLDVARRGAFYRYGEENLEPEPATQVDDGF